jgi:hypothetical protein
MKGSLAAAPTVTEALLWSWLLGYAGAERLLFEELQITDFEGSGDEPENFVGCGP